MADLSILSAEEREILEAFRRKKGESSASKTQSPSKSIIVISQKEDEVEASSSEKSQMNPIEAVVVEDLSSPISSHQKGVEQPQSVAQRVKRKSANAPSIKMQDLEEAEEPKSKKGKLDKGRKSATKAAVTEKEEARNFGERNVVAPIIVNDDFWTVELDPQEEELYGSHITSFHRMLELQGWEKLLTEPFEVCDDVVREFYQSMSFVPAEEDCPANVSIISWRGNNLMLSPPIIGTTLSVPAKEGFDVLVRKKTWPKGKGYKSRAEVMQKIFDGKNPKQPQAKLLTMDKKLLHLFIIRNVVPRKEHRDQVTIGDAILMEKIISGSLVNLPAIILSHMQYCQAHETHGLPYPHLVKKFLSQLQLYPANVKEVPCTKFLTMVTVRKVLVDEEEKPKVEAPPSDVPTAISVPSPEPSIALLSMLERIEQAIIEAGRNQVNAIVEAGKAQLNAIKAEALFNAEAHADTHKLVHDLWECETNFIKQLEVMIRERFIFSKEARKATKGSVPSGEKGNEKAVDVSAMAPEAKDDAEKIDATP